MGDAAFTASFTASPANGPVGVAPAHFELDFTPPVNLPLPTFVAVPEASTYGVMGVLALGALVTARRWRLRAKN
jgi:hypothetical protein